MQRLLRTTICGSLLVGAMPAAGATLVFSGGAVSGANGRIFTVGAGSEAISVRASAWTLNGSSIAASTLGVFAGGLGVTNGVEDGGGGNSHTIDNLKRSDFIILHFNKKVMLGNATFSAYQQSGLNYTDTDATIGWGNTAMAWNVNLAIPDLTALTTFVPAGNLYASGNDGAQGTNTRNIDPLLYSGNVWIVSSAMGAHNADGKIDSFKLNNLFYTTTIPVPEPASWMMMIVGFGMVGSAIRRRRGGLAIALPA